MPPQYEKPIGPNQNVTIWFPYEKNLTAINDAWTCVNITPDMINPRVWDPGETMSCQMYITEKPPAGKPGMGGRDGAQRRVRNGIFQSKDLRRQKRCQKANMQTEEDKKKNLLSTGNMEMDKKLSDGFPLKSLNLIEGANGTGKSVIAQQIMWGGLNQWPHVRVVHDRVRREVRW